MTTSRHQYGAASFGARRLPTPIGLIVYAAVGDHLVVRSARLGRPTRRAEILEVHGRDGAPPYVVRWQDTGRESWVHPGADASVEHSPRESHWDEPAHGTVGAE